MSSLKIQGHRTEKIQALGLVVSMAAVVTGGGQGLWSLQLLGFGSPSEKQRADGEDKSWGGSSLRTWDRGPDLEAE